MNLNSNINWASKSAGRLRYLVAASGGSGEAQIRGQIVDELESMIKEVPQNDRRNALLALLDHFPGLSEGFSTPAAPAPSLSDSSFGLPFVSPPLSSLELANRLAEAWPRLGDEERAACERRLAEAGIIKQPAAASPLAGLSQQISLEKSREADAVLGVEILKARLDMDPEVPVDLGKLLRMIGIVVPSVESLEEWVWTVWRQLAPASQIQRSGLAGRSKFTQRTGVMLAGGPADAGGYQATLENTQRLLVALLNGLGLATRNFSKEFTSRISPEAIEREIRQQNRFRAGGLEALCWELFRKRSDDLTANAILHSLRAALAKAVEELYHSGSPAWQS
jgi:hypothetical protein